MSIYVCAQFKWWQIEKLIVEKRGQAVMADMIFISVSSTVFAKWKINCVIESNIISLKKKWMKRNAILSLHLYSRWLPDTQQSAFDIRRWKCQFDICHAELFQYFDTFVSYWKFPCKAETDKIVIYLLSSRHLLLALSIVVFCFVAFSRLVIAIIMWIVRCYSFQFI